MQCCMISEKRSNLRNYATEHDRAKSFKSRCVPNFNLLVMHMKIGIVLSTIEAEVVWNVFRLGLVAEKANHEVKVFLINNGVEIDGIDSEKYNIKEQIAAFLENKGQILACGTCLKSRKEQGSDICSISTMTDLLSLVEESDKILTFG